jgi:hypothetical protein
VEPAAGAIVSAVASSIREQIERTVHLIGLAPEEHGEWRPPIPGAWPVGELLGHLLDCLAGFCAVLYAAHPEGLAHFAGLRKLPVNCVCSAGEARERIATYRLHIEQGFALLTDADLTRKLPTVFVADGEPVLTLLLGNGTPDEPQAPVIHVSEAHGSECGHAGPVPIPWPDGS